MSDLFDYLMWRGDILFSQLPPNNVDALIFSALSYIDYDDIPHTTIIEDRHDLPYIGDFPPKDDYQEHRFF